MAESPPKNILDVLGVQEVKAGYYESVGHPEQMGNAAAIAYGGCALGVACMAAHKNLPVGHRVYTMSGNYLGPSLTDRKLFCRVQDVRQTRTFTTRLVTVSQRQNDSSERSCLVALIDFHLIESAAMFTYSKPPTRMYAAPGSQLNVADLREKRLRQGVLSSQLVDLHKKLFGLMTRMFETRTCEEGISGQTLNGLIKDVPTTQDQLPLTDRTSADWWRCRTPLSSRDEQAAALAFVMDAAVSFIPLTHQRMSLDDAGACSSLDFSLRIFTNDFDINRWLLREWRTIAAAAGRTYSESQLWDEHGTMIASMTQASIMRPKPPRRTDASKL